MNRSFEILAAEYRPMVLSYLRAVVGDEHLAEDLTQETLLVAHGKIDDFEPGRSFGAWLRGIARNKAMHDQRVAARRPVVFDSRVVDGVEEVYQLFDDTAGIWEFRLRSVRRCAGRLNDNLRTVVEAVYGRGESIQRVADEMGLRFAAVAKRLSRARELIRECVEQSVSNQKVEESKHARTR